MQSKRWSLIETFASTAIGLIVSFVANIFVLPLYGCHPSISQNIGITAFFTVISVVRGFWVRRLFNWIHIKFHTTRTI